MLHRLLPVILVSLVAWMGAAGCATGSAGATLDNAEAIVAPWVSHTEPGVAVAVAMDGNIMLTRGAGMANLEYGQPIAPNSAFQVASVSKQFTAFAVLLLVDDGRLHLEDDIRQYLPELAPTPRVITVRHLLEHTGGLREQFTLSVMAGWLDDDIKTSEQMLRLAARQRGVNFPAGSEVEYSNTGYALLAEIVARVSGQSFQSFTSEQIFAPLGMTRTQFPPSRNALIPGRVASYYPSDDGFRKVVVASELLGSTGLYTTAVDLLKWADNFETRIVGSDAVFRMMTTRAKAENGDSAVFANGQEQRTYNGLETWSHGGRDAGFRSFLLRVPARRFAVSILSNRTDFDTAKMAFALADVFLADTPEFAPSPPTEWVPATDAQQRAYAGTYEINEGTYLTIRAAADGVTFASFGASANELTPLPQSGAHRFVLNADSDLSIEFDPPKDGASPGFDYIIGLHGSIHAKRVALEPFEPDSVRIAEYVGTYRSDELGTTYRFLLRDGTLVADHPRRPPFTLTPYQPDAFLGTNGPLAKVEFLRDDSGVIIGLQASAALAEKVTFVRERSP